MNSLKVTTRWRIIHKADLVAAEFGFAWRNTCLEHALKLIVMRIQN
jgi:hypothetical protein